MISADVVVVVVSGDNGEVTASTTDGLKNRASAEAEEVRGTTSTAVVTLLFTCGLLLDLLLLRCL